tara:strand:+ start:274 stop:663 length:390 start_codon:yes stop_codon:yes gene_type:complete
MFEVLNDKNIDLYMMKAYENPHCVDMDEYYDDVKTFKYLKRLLNRYEKTGELKERLILNHLHLLYNVFGVTAATRILFFKIDEEFWSTLSTFLIYLNFMPDRVDGIRGETILASDISVNFDVANRLREI